MTIPAEQNKVTTEATKEVDCCRKKLICVEQVNYQCPQGQAPTEDDTALCTGGHETCADACCVAQPSTPPPTPPPTAAPTAAPVTYNLPTTTMPPTDAINLLPITQSPGAVPPTPPPTAAATAAPVT